VCCHSHAYGNNTQSSERGSIATHCLADRAAYGRPQCMQQHQHCREQVEGVGLMQAPQVNRNVPEDGMRWTWVNKTTRRKGGEGMLISWK